MCEKCAKLDKKIEHCREMSRWVADQMALKGIEILIAKYQDDKNALHPGNKAP